MRHGKIKKCLLFAAVYMICLPFVFSAADSESQAAASLEIGADSLSRRFFRPTLEFTFPAGKGRMYFRIDYLQRLNRRLEGTIDFWLTGGFKKHLNEKLNLFIELNHMCRHETSRFNPEVLDINETAAGLSLEAENLNFKLGGGPYIGKNPAYRYLLLAGAHWRRIFHSDFSLNAEVKNINGSLILYQAELACAVHPGLDLFFRRERRYEYPDSSYLGLRFKSLSQIPGSIDKLSSRLNAVIFDRRHKVEADNEFILTLYQKKNKRLMLEITAQIPVLDTENFLGPFRPDEISYPISMEYEYKIHRNLRLLVYGRYVNSMPVDSALPYREHLGIGVGFRNQAYFDRLSKPFRIHFRGGTNFSKEKFAELKAGLNTRPDKTIWGTESRLHLLGDILNARWDIFFEFGSSIRIRPLLSWAKTWDLSTHLSHTRLFAGIELLKWF